MKRKIWLLGGIGLVCGILIFVSFRYQNTKTARLPDRYGQEIEQWHSITDRDEDGVDDQTDILEGRLPMSGRNRNIGADITRADIPMTGTECVRMWLRMPC